MDDIYDALGIDKAVLRRLSGLLMHVFLEGVGSGAGTIARTASHDLTDDQLDLISQETCEAVKNAEEEAIWSRLAELTVAHLGGSYERAEKADLN